MIKGIRHSVLGFFIVSIKTQHPTHSLVKTGRKEVALVSRQSISLYRFKRTEPEAVIPRDSDEEEFVNVVQKDSDSFFIITSVQDQLYSSVYSRQSRSRSQSQPVDAQFEQWSGAYGIRETKGWRLFPFDSGKYATLARNGWVLENGSILDVVQTPEEILCLSVDGEGLKVTKLGSSSHHFAVPSTRFTKGTLAWIQGTVWVIGATDSGEILGWRVLTSQRKRRGGLEVVPSNTSLAPDHPEPERYFNGNVPCISLKQVGKDRVFACFQNWTGVILDLVGIGHPKVPGKLLSWKVDEPIEFFEVDSKGEMFAVSQHHILYECLPRPSWEGVYQLGSKLQVVRMVYCDKVQKMILEIIVQDDSKFLVEVWDLGMWNYGTEQPPKQVIAARSRMTVAVNYSQTILAVRLGKAEGVLANVPGAYPKQSSLLMFFDLKHMTVLSIQLIDQHTASISLIGNSGKYVTSLQNPLLSIGYAITPMADNIRVILPSRENPTEVCSNADGTEIYVGGHQENTETPSPIVIVKTNEDYSTPDYFGHAEQLLPFVRGTYVELEEFLQGVSDSIVTISSSITAYTDFYKYDYDYLHGHTGAIACLALSKDGKYLMSGSKSGEVALWNISAHKKILIHLVTTPTQRGFSSLLKTDSHLLAVNLSSELYVWDLKTWNLLGKGRSNSIEYYEKSKGECVFWWCRVQNSAGVLHIDFNPEKSLFQLKYSNMKGNPDTPGDLENYLRKLYMNFAQSYEAQYNNILLKYNFGILHIYAYFRLTDHLKQALVDGAPMMLGDNGHTALSILISQRNTELVETFMSLLATNIVENRYLANVLHSKTLPQLAELMPHMLAEYYTRFLIKAKHSMFRDVIPITTKLPVLVSANDVRGLSDLQQNLVANYSKEVPRHQYAVFKQFCFPVESIECTISLLENQNKTLFSNPAVALILAYKWRSARKFAMAQSLLYFLYLGLLVAYALTDYEYVSLLAISFVLSVLFGLYEVSVILADWRYYFRDKWNYVDWLRCLVFLIYFILELSEFPGRYSLLVTTLIVSFLRGVNYFASFDRTRYMTFLLEQVVKDMVAFVLLVLYVLFSISVLFSIEGTEAEGAAINNYLSFVVKMSLGDFDTEEFGTFEMILFFATVFFLTVMMLNLLISILSDSFDNVQSNKTTVDNITKASLILEYENFQRLRMIRHLFPHSTEKKYIIVCELHKQLDVPIWQGREKNTTRLMAGLFEKHVKQRLLALEQRVAKNQSDVASKLDRLLSQANS